MSAALTVRSAQPGEYREVGALTVAAFAAGPYGPATDPARLALLSDAAGRAATGDLLVAADAVTGDLVGTASLLRAGTGYARTALADEAELRLLAVAAPARGRGVAATLMRGAIDRARGWGASALVVDTGPANLTAQRLYHRLGFDRRPDRETTAVPGVGVLAVFRFDLRRRDGVAIRLARADEIDRVAALSVTAYTSEYVLPADYVASIADVGPRAREHEVWVAQDRATGELLGTVTTPRPGANLSPLGRPGELDFRLLAVDPAARGRGIGELLTRHVIAVARWRGLDRVVLNSGPDMLPAHRLYERLGFARLPARETVLLPDGRPLYVYGLDLDRGRPATLGA
ncbi:GNAT family N-acetyltransferase [Pengzhenrongella sicca]|uniref:GNAT family N-acetyltransferase n=1 Tax=Pengzhenrongella sicca TaxID=2819238 RepID=A0A8A4ZG47_9MICO|nr:GNAT family N-acetyltransferase [Pengzhenrongella sicca]QTE28638.1 GNAT family N-acetyltransferase [Pengzhenrongella sicca]